MGEPTYKVSVSGPGLTLEREVPAPVGERVVVLILSDKSSQTTHALAGDTGRTPAPGGADLPPGDAQGGMSIREYLDDRAAKRNPDKITAIGCYLKDHRGKGSFNRADLEEMFQAAAEAVPKNIPRDIRWATRVGWIAPRSNEQGTYYVTAKGIEAVSNKFPKDLIKKTSQATGKTRRTRKNNNSEE